jgi:molybdopterin-guanine dinucleotide biosynthesis protein A
MGSDKALLPLRGAPLAHCVAQAVAAAAGSATLVGDPERYSGLGFPVLPDLFPGEGPLGGILTALRQSEAEWNLIVACDMPEIGGALLSGLLNAAKRSGADALLPVTPEGRPQPLCAAYRRTSLDRFEAVFAAGTRKVTAALDAVRCVRLPTEEVAQFQNVNTPEDWAAYARG